MNGEELCAFESATVAVLVSNNQDERNCAAFAFSSVFSVSSKSERDHDQHTQRHQRSRASGGCRRLTAANGRKQRPLLLLTFSRPVTPLLGKKPVKNFSKRFGKSSSKSCSSKQLTGLGQSHVRGRSENIVDVLANLRQGAI